MVRKLMEKRASSGSMYVLSLSFTSLNKDGNATMQEVKCKEKSRGERRNE